jgi:conjugal transfer/entry exclusion protein
MPVTASAQWAVFDAGNFTRNALTAIQTANMYSQQLTDHAVRIQQLMTMLRNLKQIDPMIIAGAVGRKVVREVVMQGGGNPDEPGWGGLSNEEMLRAAEQTLDVYRSTNRFTNQSKALYQQVGDFSIDMERFSAASGMSWQQIFEYEIKRARAGRALANAKYQQASEMQKQLASYQSRADQQLQTAANSEGAVQAIGAMASLNHTMSDQLSSLIAASARREQLDAAKLERESQDEERRRRLEAEGRRAAESQAIRR